MIHFLTKTICAAMMFMMAICSCAFAVEQSVTGKVESVVLYRGQAMITRSVPVTGPAGMIELVVGEMPKAVMPDSLFAEGSEDIEVRAVRYRTRAVGEDPREDIRKLDEQIEQIQDKIKSNQKMQELVKQQHEYLNKLEGFVAPTAITELSKGVLNAQQLKDLTGFQFEKRQELITKGLELEKQLMELNKQLELVTRQKGELSGGAIRTVREAVVFLQKRGAGAGQVSLNYLVADAGWSPLYNFRGDMENGQVRIEYNAIIRQRTGEDWSDVRLKLSTVSPTLSAEGTALAPFTVALAPIMEGKGIANEEKALKEDLGVLREQQKKAEEGQQRMSTLMDNRGYNWDMNTAANALNVRELTNPREVFQRLLTEQEIASAEGPSITYSLANPVSLPSKDDQQMVRINEITLKSSFYYLATPVLTSYVYRQAEILNTSGEALLNGPVSVYLDGRFVGKGEIPTVAGGQTFVLGFGTDTQLRARRELTERTDNAQGGNRELNFTYRIEIDNYKDTPVTIRVMDRIPISDDKASIRVTLAEKMSDKLSDDPLYKRIEQPKGIMRWDIEVPASSAGEKTRMVEYSYKVEFPKNMTLTTPGSDDQRRMEFYQMNEDLRQR
jgi:uncharacterized protein (TIGR02231 family)